MPTNTETDINDYEPITPTHVKVEIIPDDDDVDPEPHVAIDTEDAKAIDLKFTFHNMLQQQRSQFAYIKNHSWAYANKEIKNLFRELDKDFSDVNALLDHADRLDAYYHSTKIYGLSKPLACLISYDYSIDKLPALESLQIEGDPNSMETMIAMEGLSSFMKSVWVNIKSAFVVIHRKLSDVTMMLISLCNDTSKRVSSTKNLLMSMKPDESKIQTYRCSLSNMGEWKKVANALGMVSMARDVVAFLQYIEKLTDKHYTDYLIAAVGAAGVAAGVSSGGVSFDPAALIGTLSYRMLTYFNQGKMKAIGVELKGTDKPVIQNNYIEERMPKTIATLTEHGWDYTTLTNYADTALRMANLGSQLPMAYDKMKKQTEVSLVQIEAIMKGSFLLTEEKETELRMDRLRLRLKLTGLTILQGMTWHVAKVSLTCSKMWLDAATHMLKCQKETTVAR